MKNRNLIFSFVSLTVLLMSGCNEATNISENASSAADYALDQSFFNRIILDYYEQRICNKKVLGNDMYSLSSASIDRSGITLDDMQLNFIMSKTNNGAYFVGVNNSLNTFGDMFYYSFNANNICYQIRIPDVWYQGNIYYLTDAYYQELINEDEVKACLEKTEDIYLYKNELLVTQADKVVYNQNVEPLKVNQEMINSSPLLKMRESLFEKAIKDNAQFAQYQLNTNDIHVFQSFAAYNNAYCVNFSIDGISSPRYIYNLASNNWLEPLAFNDVTIEPFQEKIPVVFVNDDFYPIDEAFSNNLINKETAAELLRQYQISIKQNNCDKYIF